MLHRAIVGSLERFIGILIENYAGALPLWLAPVQVVCLNIPSTRRNMPQGVARTCKNKDLGREADLRNEKINYKIREHSLQKMPYHSSLSVTRRWQANTVAVRARRARTWV